MKKILLAVFILATLSASAQKYWQQKVNYTIQVTLDDVKHELSASEEIEYINNSPDQLTFIYFHLWPNAYKNNKTAFAKQQLVNNSLKFQFADNEKRGFIDQLNFKVNGQPARLEYDTENPDIAKLILNEPLKPGNSIRISTPFHVKLPASFSRLGHVGQSYQITQWYPKPAVYDQTGWHQMPYLDQGEFYSEFGSFDISITLPANYTVGATGVLQTPSETERMNQLAAATEARSNNEADMSFPASSGQQKTLRYTQDNIHDFAWFADKRFQVLKSSVNLPYSGRNVTTWQLFLPKNAKSWLNHKTDIDTATYYYSLWVGEYPYDQVTAVDGALSAGAGMEYPMVTVTIPEATIHEVGHNWFYGILASNERQYPWMDEGINSYIENRIAQRGGKGTGQLDFLINNKNISGFFGIEKLNSAALNQLPYQMGASRGLDQPIELHSKDYESINYGTIVYMKTAAAFNYLENYLGTAKFDSAMHTYYRKWRFKHPYPNDIQKTFEEVSGENLNWFFDEFIPKTEQLNLALTHVEKGNPGSGLKLRLENKGDFPAPAEVAALDKDGNILETQWTKPFTGETHLYFTQNNIHSFLLDPDFVIPEVNRRNNHIRTTGILRKWEPLKPQFLAGVEQPQKSQLYIAPVVGANTYNKFMLGAAFYNNSLIQKRLSTFFMPMYSFHEKKITGISSLQYNIITQSIARQIRISSTSKSFEKFITNTIALDIDFRRSASNKPFHSVRLANTQVFEEFAPDIVAQYIRYEFLKKNALQQFIVKAQLHRYHIRELNPFNVDGFLFKENQYTLRAEAIFKRHYTQKDEIRIRVFGGKFLDNKTTNHLNEIPYIQFGLSGSPDYLKETIFLDRSQKSSWLTAFEHQTDNRDGAFKQATPYNFTNWLGTVNLEADIPFIPLAVYAEIAKSEEYSIGSFYGAGFALPIADNFLQIYFPVVGTNYERTGEKTGIGPDNFKDFRNNIRFYLNLNLLNPFDQIEKALGGK